MAGEPEWYKRRFPISQAAEDGTGACPFLGKLLQRVFDRFQFVIREHAANTNHKGMGNGVGGKVDVGRVRETFSKLLGVSVPEVVSNGHGAADFITGWHETSRIKGLKSFGAQAGVSCCRRDTIGSQLDT